MPAQPPTLNYESTAGGKRRISVWWWVALVLLCAVVAAAIEIPPLWKAHRARQQANLIRLHKQGLMPAIKTDAPAPTMVAYEDDLTRAAALRPASEYITINGWDDKPRAARLPAAWFELRYECWNWWDSETADKPILFAHARTTTGGIERVLIVYGIPAWPEKTTRVTLRTLVLDSKGDAWHVPAACAPPRL